MEWVPVRQIRSGMRLAKSIVLPDGRLWLIKGSELKETYVNPMLEQGIMSVYVVNELAPDLVVHDVVAEESRQQLTEEMRQVIRNVRPAVAESTHRGVGRFGSALNLDRLKSAVDRIVDELLGNRTVVYHLKDLRAADDYTLGHSVNVCVLSTLLGSVCDLNQNEMKDLAVGALLHDIGKTLTPPAILGKPGKLTPDETNVMNRHTTDGWNILKEQQGIPYSAAIVALQHHERWAGGGYPKGIKGSDIFKYSRICSVADCFDAMTADRPYRQGMSAARTLHIMQGEMAHFFEPELLKKFADCIAPYPVGSLVEITGGRKAVVVEVRRGHTYRPRIRLVLEADGTRIQEAIELELIDHPRVQITEVLREGTPFVPDDLVSAG
ncbi:MAG TPA: HD-GYP domain-containing protein [Symbiobacteriaceae bacterium]|nr:HD-GYP domain-containing protein [Symbiobacteriaceae bacterium]